MIKKCIYCGCEVVENGRVMHPYYCPDCDEDFTVDDVVDVEEELVETTNID